MRHFLRLQCGGGLTPRDKRVALSPIQHPRFNIVIPLLIENILKLLLQIRVFNRAQHLNAVINVPSH